MRPRSSGQGWLPRYGGGWMHQFGHVYALQQELLDPNAQSWFRASELWHTARQEGIALNVSHYGNILRQCVRPAAWEQSLAVLQQMQRESTRPDVHCVGCALAACVEAGQHERVEELFAQFQPRMLLDSVCYLALIRSRAERGEAAAAVAAGRQQEGEGVPLLPYTFTHLLEACDVADDDEYALHLVRRMHAEEWLPCQRSQAAVRRLALRHPHAAEALQDYEDFRPALEDARGGRAPPE